MTERTASRPCPRCGAALPPVAPEGLCTRCLPAAPSSYGSAEDTRTGPPRSPSDGRTTDGLGPGARLGPYELRLPLGRGGFAEVWEAEVVDTGRRLALKVLAPARELSREAVARFEREGRLAASLNDPNCVYVYEAGTFDGRPAIAMELMRGGTLQDLVRDQGPLPYRRAVDAILDVIAGLEAAEKLGIVHRDVKPSNCFLDQAGRVRIGDFGLSKTLEADSALSVSGGFLGTPSYASPEQVRGAEVDSRSDLYSVGATLFTLLSSRPPFVARNANEVLAKILEEDVAPLKTHGVRLPRGLEDVVRRAMSRARERRYSSYTDLRRALLPFSSTGFATAALVRRLAAILIDNSLLVMTTLGLMMVGGWGVVMKPIAILPLAVTFSYFWLSEGIWGRSIGKRIMGLRVTSVDGGPATLKQAFVRTFVFFAFLTLGALPSVYRYNSGTLLRPQSTLESLFSSVLQLGLQWSFAVTMRRRNGFAGVHELLSGTRVREAEVQTPLEVPMKERAGVAAATSAFFGPYETVGTLWQTPSQGLHLAWDPLLRRQVWVHDYANATARATPSELAADSPGRLHWLQGSCNGDRGWDAYEAPSGTSFLDWVKTVGRLDWPATRTVLLGLLDALSAKDQRRGPRSVLEVWVDSGGRVRVLDFPAMAEPGETYHRPGPRLEADAFEITPGRWDALARQALVLALEGSLTTEAELDRSVATTVGMRVPLRARDFVLDAVSGLATYSSPQAMADALRALPSVPARVGRRRRLAAFLATLVPALLPVAGAVMSLVMLRMSPGLIEVGQIPEYIRLAEDPAKPLPEREAARVLLVSTWTKFQGTPAGDAFRSALPDRERALVDALARDRPKVTEDELQRARKLLKRPELATIRSDRRFPPFVLWMMPVMALGMMAPFAMILSTVLRGPVSFALLGIAVTRNDDGAPASRRRCFARAALAWSPVIAAVIGMFMLGFQHANAAAIPLALLAVASVSALADPHRGLVDRLAGTRLVRR